MGLRSVNSTHSRKFDTCQIRYEDGQLPEDQLPALLGMLRLFEPKIVLEIGTYFGHTTRAMAETLPESTIHTLDLPELFKWNSDLDDWHLIGRRDVGREFRGQPCASRIVQHLADSRTWDWSQAAGATFFFIDGSHSYNYCQNDSVHCWDLCAGKGVFVWHDVDEQHVGVVQVTKQWASIGRPVRKFVEWPIAYCATI
jgi:hypothetical protein